MRTPAFETLRHWLQPPRSAAGADEERARRARLLHVVGLGLVAALVLPIVHNWLAGDRGAAVVLAVEGAVILGAVVISRRGSVGVAGMAIAISLPLMATALVLVSSTGRHDIAMMIFPAAVIVGGLTLKRPALAALTLLSIVCAVAVAIAGGLGYLAVDLPRVAPLRDAVDVAVILIATALGVDLTLRDLHASLQRARQREDELREANLAAERRAEELLASEERYRALVNLGVDAIVMTDSAGRIIEANRQAAELSGRDAGDLIGRPLEDILGAELGSGPLGDQESLRAGRTVTVEQIVRRADGSSVPVEISSKRMPDGTHQTFLRDISERRRAESERERLESELRQAHKMEALGRLAGGVAHDFNNLLTAITGSLSLAQRDVAAGSRLSHWLHEADTAAGRAAGLTRQLLAFGRKQIIDPRVLDMRQLLQELQPMLARLIGEDIELALRLPAEALGVRVDRNQIEQVVLNLGANARDAMPRGGQLTIELSSWESTSDWLTRHEGVEAGPFVQLTVGDTGTGMAPETLRHVFEPFYTTKTDGSGMGLGMAMAYGAVRQNGGAIEIDSVQQLGTTVRVYLPRVELADTVGEADSQSDDLPTGSETVLLVEDEAIVREVASEQLESLGYRVLPCANGDAALSTAGRHEGPIHAVVTDVVMPGMNGREVAKRLEGLRPGIRVLFTSGYGEHVIAEHGVVNPGVAFLEKPYTLPELARKMYALLRE